MENGFRGILGPVSFAATAVDIDWAPAVPVQIIDIQFITDAADTAGDIFYIYSHDAAGNDWLEGSKDFTTLVAPENVNYTFRLDKRLEANETLKIDYANTDGNNIKVRVRYQIDGNVSCA